LDHADDSARQHQRHRNHDRRARERPGAGGRARAGRRITLRQTGIIPYVLRPEIGAGVRPVPSRGELTIMNKSWRAAAKVSGVAFIAALAASPAVPQQAAGPVARYTVDAGTSS